MNALSFSYYKFKFRYLVYAIIIKYTSRINLHSHVVNLCIVDMIKINSWGQCKAIIAPTMLSSSSDIYRHHAHVLCDIDCLKIQDIMSQKYLGQYWVQQKNSDLSNILFYWKLKRYDAKIWSYIGHSKIEMVFCAQAWF